jgi:RimJ/RimL family protein N-acetyltransferase
LLSDLITAASISSDRLSLEPLSFSDAPFIVELVNTPGWIEFIGDRNIHSEADATIYIQKIKSNPNVTYWVVKLLHEPSPIGVITFIKRDYLAHPDIGFAFLPAFGGKGYALEATRAVMNFIAADYEEEMLASTLPSNQHSIRLLKKLGFIFHEEINVDGETLHIYAVSADKLQLDMLVHKFFNLFNNSNNRQPDWSMLYSICIPEARITSKTDAVHTAYTLSAFIEPRQKILTDGTLRNFKEWEINEQTKIRGNIAQRFSSYRKRGELKGQPFEQQGNKFFQFIKTVEGWKISAVLWEDEKAGHS